MGLQAATLMSKLFVRLPPAQSREACAAADALLGGRKGHNLGDDLKKTEHSSPSSNYAAMCNLILTHKIDRNSFANRCCKLQRIPVRQSNTPVRFGLADLIRIRRTVNTIAFC